MEVQWSLVIFTALAGIGSWLYALLAVSVLKGDKVSEKTQKVVSWVTIALVVIGGVASVTHLSHPDRIMAVLGHPTVGIFMEALFAGILALAVIVFVVMVYRGVSEGARKAVLGAGAVIAVAFTFALGYSYMMPARPVWDTILLPIAYMLTAFAGGAAGWLTIAAACKEEEATLKLAAVELIVAGVLAGVATLLYAGVSGAIETADVWAWGVVVLCVAVVPFAVGFVVRTKPAQAFSLGMAATIFALIGVTGFRAVMWVAGAAVQNYFGVII